MIIVFNKQFIYASFYMISCVVQIVLANQVVSSVMNRIPLSSPGTKHPFKVANCFISSIDMVDIYDRCMIV